MPRDSCLFELGSFIGALNLEPGRCFLVTSLNKDALPPDIGGYIYYKIDEPDNWEDYVERERCIKTVRVNIADRVNKKALVRRLPEDISISVEGNSIELKRDAMCIKILHTAELMRLEITDNNRLESDSEVLVQKLDPIEIKLEWAQMVQTNMSRGITYHYFFSIDKSTDPKCNMHVAHLIRAIAIYNCLDQASAGQWSSYNEGIRLALVQKHLEAVRQNLQQVKRQLFIHFIPYRLAEEFRIHNAGSERRRGYLRWIGTEYFLELNQEQARLKGEAYRRFMHGSSYTIFGSTADLPLYGVDQALQLGDALKQTFTTGLINDEKEIFFGR